MSPVQASQSRWNDAVWSIINDGPAVNCIKEIIMNVQCKCALQQTIRLCPLYEIGPAMENFQHWCCQPVNGRLLGNNCLLVPNQFLSHGVIVKWHWWSINTKPESNLLKRHAGRPITVSINQRSSQLLFWQRSAALSHATLSNYSSYGTFTEWHNVEVGLVFLECQWGTGGSKLEYHTIPPPWWRG